MKLKKIIFIPIAFILVLAAIFAGWCFIGKQPFKNLSADEVEQIEVQLRPPDVTFTLNEDQKTKAVSLLRDIVVYYPDFSAGRYGGQAVIFTITKTDGSKSEVNVFTPFVFLNGFPYHGEYDPCEALNQFANELLQPTQ